MKRLLAAATALFLLIPFPAHAEDADGVAKATAVATSWLALTYAGQYQESWKQASSLFRASVNAIKDRRLDDRCVAREWLVASRGIRDETLRPTGFQSAEQSLLERSRGRIEAVDVDLAEFTGLLQRMGVVQEIGRHVTDSQAVFAE